jgi:hypothetical protein
MLHLQLNGARPLPGCQGRVTEATLGPLHAHDGKCTILFYYLDKLNAAYEDLKRVKSDPR